MPLIADVFSNPYTMAAAATMTSVHSAVAALHIDGASVAQAHRTSRDGVVRRIVYPHILAGFDIWSLSN